jgi:hypothetical protein
MPPTFVNVLTKWLRCRLEISGFPGTDNWAAGSDLTEAGVRELPRDDATYTIVVDENADPICHFDDGLMLLIYLEPMKMQTTRVTEPR